MKRVARLLVKDKLYLDDDIYSHNATNKRREDRIVSGVGRAKAVYFFSPSPLNVATTTNRLSLMLEAAF